MGLKNTRVEGTYASVSADGLIRVKVEPNTPNAKFREGDLRDGTHYEKWELVYNELSGFITNVNFYDGDFGKNIQITIDDKSGDVPTILCLSANSNFGEDFLKKLPAINLEEEVTIKPYSLVDKANKTRKGVSVTQGENKITSFFSKKEGDKIVLTNGMPIPSEKMDKEDWKIYFMTVDKFLVKYTEDNILPKFVGFGTDELSGAVEDDTLSIEDVQM